jgi:hypothetical protein
LLNAARKEELMQRLTNLSLVALLSGLAACAPSQIDQGGASADPEQCVNTELGRRCYTIVDGVALSGDIVLGPASRFAGTAGRSENSFLSVGGKKWSDNTIPYVIDSSSFSSAGLKRITDAVAEYNAKTVLRWVPRTTETDYVHFAVSPNHIFCDSPIGRHGGEQIVHVDSNGGCSVAHEMGHSLGLLHEMERPDRDQYVKVHYENVESQFKGAFDIISIGGNTSTPYDLASVMHYDAYAFTSNGKATITLVNGSTAGLDQKFSLSPGDVAALAQFYDGGGKGGKPLWCGAMAVEERLGPGDTLFSCDDSSFLWMKDGDLVLIRDSVKVWAANTTDGQHLIMEGTGNLVLYSDAGSAVWSSNTYGPGATLFLQDDGNLVVQTNKDPLPASPPFPLQPGVLWATNTAPPPAPGGCGAVFGNEGLGPNDSIWSCDGRFQLVMQGDGNLVLYQGGIAGGTAIWATGTDGKAGYGMWMQNDGNFVLYSETQALWASNTDGTPGSYLRIQDDGNLVVYAAAGNPLWASNTCCR